MAFNNTTKSKATGAGHPLMFRDILHISWKTNVIITDFVAWCSNAEQCMQFYNKYLP